jgi:long-chain acyl-CoA synthetase
MSGQHGGAAYRHPCPWALDLPPLSLPDLLAATATRTPRACALDFFGARTGYAELAVQVDRFAAGLQGMGLAPGDRLGLFLPNCPHYPVAYYGALRAGLVVVNFSPLYSAEELAAQVVDSGVRTMVCLDAAALYPTIETVRATSPLERLIIGSIAEALPQPQATLFRLLKRRERIGFRADAAHVPFARLQLPGAPRPHAIDPERDLALIQYTGGTTGRPKGALLTHQNLTANARQIHVVDPEPDFVDRVLGALPFFHVFANTAVLNVTVMRGGEIVMLPRFDAAQALAAIRRRKVTAVPGVPTMFAALADHPDAAGMDWSSLRLCVSGGAPMPVELAERFERLTGVRVSEGYGLTETAGVASVNPYRGERKLGTIGQPIPRTTLRLVSRDDPAQPAPPGEPGEICIEGPQVMRGYLHAPQPDPAAFTPQGWLRTGDVGLIDADGFASVVDRLKDMIVVGGFKVFPSRIEDVLYTHPDVREALAVPTPDPRVGERPKAFVALREGATATAADLLALVNAHVGKHERPVAVEIRASLPKTPIGKLSRKELVAEERARAAAP